MATPSYNKTIYLYFHLVKIMIFCSVVFQTRNDGHLSRETSENVLMVYVSTLHFVKCYCGQAGRVKVTSLSSGGGGVVGREFCVRAEGKRIRYI